MSFTFQPGAVTTVSDYAGLMAARKSFGRFACEYLVKGFVVGNRSRIRNSGNCPSICKTSLSDKRGHPGFFSPTMALDRVRRPVGGSEDLAPLH